MEGSAQRGAGMCLIAPLLCFCGARFNLYAARRGSTKAITASAGHLGSPLRPAGLGPSVLP